MSPGRCSRFLCPSNVICTPAFPRVFDFTNRVTTSYTPVRTEADLTLKWMMADLSDHLGRLEEEGWGNGQAQRLGGLEIDH